MCVAFWICVSLSFNSFLNVSEAILFQWLFNVHVWLLCCCYPVSHPLLWLLIRRNILFIVSMNYNTTEWLLMLCSARISPPSQQPLEVYLLSLRIIPLKLWQSANERSSLSTVTMKFILIEANAERKRERERAEQNRATVLFMPHAHRTTHVSHIKLIQTIKYNFQNEFLRRTVVQNPTGIDIQCKRTAGDRLHINTA